MGQQLVWHPVLVYAADSCCNQASLFTPRDTFWVSWIVKACHVHGRLIDSL